MDRRRTLLCASALAATLFVAGGGSALGQQSADPQQRQPSGSPPDSGAQSSQQRQPGGDASGQAAPAGARIGQSRDATATDADKMFIKNAAVGNMTEMKLAQAAQDKAQSADVKKLAQDMLRDHQQMDQQLKEVAQKTGVQLPQDLPDGVQQEVQTISQLQGDEFDKQFVSCVKAGHAAAISRYGDVAKIAKNEDVKQFAAQQLPTLQRHGEQVLTVAAAQGLGTESLGQQAQPASTTIPPSQQQDQQRQPGSPHDSSGKPGSTGTPPERSGGAPGSDKPQ